MGKRQTNEEYSVERIVEHRDGDLQTEYLIEWTGYVDFTWIGRSEFVQATDVLANYWENFLKNSADPVIDSAKYFLDLGPLYKKQALYVAKGLEVKDGIEKAYRQLKKTCKVPTAVQAYVHSLFRNVDDINTKLRAIKRQMPKQLQLMGDANLDVTINSIDEEAGTCNLVEETGPLADQLDESNSGHLSEIDDCAAAFKTAAEQFDSTLYHVVVNNTEGDPADGLLDEETDAFNESGDLVIALEDETVREDRVNVKSKKLTCDFLKCGKTFKTKKGLRDHKRYHKSIPCSWKNCKWTGAMKKFNEHVRKAHPELKILVARQHAGLDCTK